MKDKINVALLGLGTVGTGVLKVLTANSQQITPKVGVPVEVSKVLVRDKNKARDIEAKGNASLTTDFEEIVSDPEIDIIVEVLGGELPAKDYIVRSLQSGKQVVTANKDVVAKYGRDLFEAAEQSKVDLMFEGSVGGGIPIIRPLKQCLAGNKIAEVMGIVNGTTNYMLTKMTNDKMEFGEVLLEAQAKGYAEADPTADVGGFDAARKIAILSSIAFGTRVCLDDVYVEGITGITSQDIEYARELGYVIKLLAIARDDENGVDVRVHPAFIPNTHPLATVNDVFNAIYVRGDAVGETMFYGRGAGQMPTASAVVGDIIDISRNIVNKDTGRILCTCFEEKRLCPIQQTESLYYIRILVEDKPGVLAAIAGAFGAQRVSLNSVIQKRKVNNCAEIVLITYKVSEADLRLAIDTIKGMSSVVNKVENVIRVVS